MVLADVNTMVGETESKTPAPGSKEEGSKESACLNVPSPMRRRKLEPSIQAWAASKGTALLQPCNVGASEAPERSHLGTPSLSVSRGRSRQEASTPRLTRSLSERQLDSERYEWSKSLRQPELSQSDFWGKSFRATVPNGPFLRTAERSRSRSCSSSREWTPSGTPERRQRSVTPRRCGMPPKEQEAVEQYLSRMALARLESPMRKKIAFGHSAEQRVAPSPARSASADSRACSEYSNESRLSQLSRPRTLPKDALSSEDLECLRAKEERHALRKQMRHNERAYKEALLCAQAEVGLSQRCTERVLTLPKGPELRTPFRAARIRSTSWHGPEKSLEAMTSRSDGVGLWGGIRKHPIAREQVAIERHLERSAAAALASSSISCTSVQKPHMAEKQVARVPDGVDVEKWVREATTAEERAQRARAATLARRDSIWEQERSKLCVFRSSAAASSPAADQVPEVPAAAACSS